MTALNEFTHNDWRDYSSANTSLPGSWSGRAKPSRAKPAFNFFYSLRHSIIAKFGVTIAAFRSDPLNRNALTLAAMLYTTVLWALLIDLNSVTRVMPEHVAQGLEVAAALWVIAARRSLSRAAAKPKNSCGIVDTGAFRFVRHPIYAGRAVLYGALLLSNFNIPNMLILLSVYVAQLYRIIVEENHLMKDKLYQNYARKVRYRMIYGVF